MGYRDPLGKKSFSWFVRERRPRPPRDLRQLTPGEPTPPRVRRMLCRTRMAWRWDDSADFAFSKAIVEKSEFREYRRALTVADLLRDTRRKPSPLPLSQRRGG